MSDWPTMPKGDENMPPGVSVRDIEDVVADARAAKGIETVADDDHHAMMNGPRIAQALGLRPRHYHDAPTIREMLDKMEEKRSCDAPCLVAMLRLAVDTLNWYANGQGPETRLDDNGELAVTTLGNIERGLWATSPRELWFEAPASESLGGGGLWKGENATPKEATDNNPS